MFVPAQIAHTAEGNVGSVIFTATGGSGIGFYTAASSKFLAVTTPCQAQLGAADAGALPDPADSFPLAGSNNFSLYVIDGAASGAIPPQQNTCNLPSAAQSPATGPFLVGIYD
jgi:hypothetical protein